MAIWVRKDKPTVEDVHVNRPLTNISVAHVQDQTAFASAQVFPVVPVAKQSDVYFTYNKDDFRRNNLIHRPPATESAGGGYRLDAASSYYAKPYAWHVDIPDELRANEDEPLKAEADAATFATQTLLIGREKLWADTFFKTGVWGTDKANTLWSAATSDPEKDIDDARVVIIKNTGMRPNTLVVDLETHNVLKRHSLVQDRFKYTSADSVTKEMLAKFFEVERYIVSEASYNSAKEEATASNAMILADNALLLYVAPTPSLMRPSAGYTFSWSGLTGLNNLGVRTKKFRIEERNLDRVEVDMAFDMKVVASDVGYFFSNTV